MGLGAPTAEIAANRAKSINFRRLSLIERLLEACAGGEDNRPQAGEGGIDRKRSKSRQRRGFMRHARHEHAALDQHARQQGDHRKDGDSRAIGPYA